ncbi:hypothetical protein AC579_4244 [Pseudocercospora musae]|uniref:Uncharacterized protein n=1 Tax=Pseudocercospora musae TaxID=113226 RepID=A0A139IFI9_9PEZI|nr:hypothetical protein AC579_4244 [Pseudocercospora musae]
MAWSSVPKSHRLDRDMEKATQQWQPKRSRGYSSPSPRPVVRGKRGVAILTSMLLVVVIFITTASFRPSYTESATKYGKSATAYGIRKWKETEEKLMGSWNKYEEENFPTSNPQMISATNDRYEDHISEPHPGFKGIGGVTNVGDSVLQPEIKEHVPVVHLEAQPEVNIHTGATHTTPSEPAVEDARVLEGVASHQEKSSKGPAEQVNSNFAGLSGVAP